MRPRSSLESSMKNNKSNLFKKKSQKRKAKIQIQKRMSNASGTKSPLIWNLLDLQDSFKTGEIGIKLTPSEILTSMKLLNSTDLEAKLEKETTTLHYQASLISKIDWNGMHGTTTKVNQENKQHLISLNSQKLSWTDSMSTTTTVKRFVGNKIIMIAWKSLKKEDGAIRS
jgi:hypothetical protein